jgi:hypothetical protein
MTAFQYQTLTQWSVIHNCNTTRVSMVDEHGQEYFTIIRNFGGKAYRKAKEEALDALEDAIRAELPPGEVQLNERLHPLPRRDGKPDDHERSLD